MSMTVQNRRIANRLVRNLVAALAVTAIFAIKATSPAPGLTATDYTTLAAR